MRPFIYSLLATFLLLSCDKKNLNNFDEIRHGYIYLACDFGPYYLDFNRILDNCSDLGVLPDSIDFDSLNVDLICLYDGNPQIIGDTAIYDVVFTRDSIHLNMEYDALQAINFENNGQLYEWDEYPFYLGFSILTEEMKIDLYMVNRYIGGCFHDLILFELHR